MAWYAIVGVAMGAIVGFLVVAVAAAVVIYKIADAIRRHREADEAMRIKEVELAYHGYDALRSFLEDKAVREALRHIPRDSLHSLMPTFRLVDERHKTLSEEPLDDHCECLLAEILADIPRALHIFRKDQLHKV